VFTQHLSQAQSTELARLDHHNQTVLRVLRDGLKVNLLTEGGHDNEGDLSAANRPGHVGIYAVEFCKAALFSSSITALYQDTAEGLDHTNLFVMPGNG